MSDLLKTVYEECRAMESAENAELENCVKSIYLPFTPDEISNKMARMLKPEGIKAKVKLIFQTMEGLESSIPDHSGDWYFSGNYPTPGGIRLVNRAYIKYYEKNFMI